jgi:hypothetical protein|tara:strand:+ start:402 stop:1478 length:1077 start_codon:yes stop_codon:yes gene_type:complete
MARNILKSNNSFVGAAFLADKEAFHTTNKNLNLFNLVQDVSFSTSFPHEQLKQIGNTSLAVNDTFYQPDVSLDISYLPNIDLNNEKFNFFSLGGTNDLRPALSGVSNASTNFYVFNDPIQGEDALTDLSFSTNLNLTSYEVLAFGNAFLTNYSLSYAIGGMPLVSTSYICSNMKFETAAGTSIESVAINLESGNNNEVGNCNFNFTNGSKTPDLVHPVGGGSKVTMQNLQVGGQVLSGIHFLQSVNLNVSLPRISSYGLGSDYAYNRKLQLPAQGSFTAKSLVSGFQEGEITGLLANESSYSFEVILQDAGSNKVLYRIEEAKLESFSYGMPVNDQMTFDSTFSFPVDEGGGLLISGA